MSEEKLRECPFCGSIPTVKELGTKYAICRCENENCFMSYSKEYILVTAWNTRHSPVNNTEDAGLIPSIDEIQQFLLSPPTVKHFGGESKMWYIDDAKCITFAGTGTLAEELYKFLNKNKNT